MRKQKRTNAWLDHVKKCKGMKANKDKSFKEVLKEAKLTYKKKK